MSSALGKFSLKNLRASSLVWMLSSEENGKNSVNVNDPSWHQRGVSARLD